MGYGSCPILRRPLHEIYTPNPILVITEYELPSIEPGFWQLGNNGENLNNGFALLHLNGTDCVVEYYEIPSLAVEQWGELQCTFKVKF